MSAKRLYEAGYGPLVSVVPPDGVLHESSKIKPTDRGKAPGLLRGGTWHGYAFTKTEVTADTIEASGANTGLLANSFPALDIDVDDPTLAQVVQELAERALGMAPVRLSREPRRLLVYRTRTPFSRVALVLTYKGKSHTVEWLGQGRQYLVHGVHPSGVDYRWDGQDLWDFEPTDLAEVDGYAALAFLEGLKNALESKGIECELVGTGKTKSEDVRPQDGLRAPSIEVLVELVDSMPNPAEWDRAQYVQMACAIKAAGQDDEERARDAFSRWCDRWEGGDNNTEVVFTDWDSLSPPYRVGWSWLQEQAQELTGYVPAVDEFDAADGPSTDVDGDPLVVISGPAPSNDEQVLHLIIDELRGVMRYVPTFKGWYQWVGNLWVQDEVMAYEEAIRAQLARLAAHWLQRAKGAPNKAQREPWLKAANKYQNSDGIGSMEKLARSRLAVRPADFDTDSWLLNTPGPLVNLRGGSNVERAEDMLLTRSTSVVPQAGAHPFWTQFLMDLAGGDMKLVEYLQKVCGYALTGDMREKTLWFIWGSNSDTGKSTFVQVLTRVMGSYAETVDAGVFVGKASGNEARLALAELPGARLVVATEPKSGQAWDEKRIKAVTGGDNIQCRKNYGKPFTYGPQFKIMFVGNHEPEIENVDDAMLRRIHIVPFNLKVPRDKQIDNLAQKLVEREGPQILQWMIDGCQLWQRDGLTPPTVVLKRTSEYAAEENMLQQWIADECETGPELKCGNNDLYRAWAGWCRQRDEKPEGQKQFTRKLRGLGFNETQLAIGTQRLKGSRGIRLRLGIEAGTEGELA